MLIKITITAFLIFLITYWMIDTKSVSKASIITSLIAAASFSITVIGVLTMIWVYL